MDNAIPPKLSQTAPTALQYDNKAGSPIERWRHKKTGSTYVLLCRATLEADLSSCVVYQSEQDQRIWVRAASEFDDGRFERI